MRGSAASGGVGLCGAERERARGREKASERPRERERELERKSERKIFETG